MKISYNNKTYDIKENISSISSYINLLDIFNDNEIFLLESLTGPERDCTQSIIGLDPLLNVSVKNNLATIS